MMRRNSSCALACLLLGCTWTRFDDVTDNPPAERFDTPNNVSGAGLSLGTFAGSAGEYMAVTSTDRVLLYSLGSGVSPSRTAVANEACPGDKSCVLARQIAGLKPSAMLDNQGCAAYGVGLSDAGTTTASGKLLMLCENADKRSLEVPASVTSWLSEQGVGTQTVVSLATARSGDSKAIAASIPDARVTWFYDGVEPTPVELPALPDSAVAGRSLAVISDSAGYLVVAGSVNTNDSIWLYRINNDRSSVISGCIQGGEQFGRLLAVGSFDGDEIDDIAVADDQRVVILKGSSITAVAQNSTDACVPLDAVTNIGTALCSQLPDLDGCAGTPYAAALAAGNLDGTGPDELIVGAPFTLVRGESAAGAAFVYRWSNNAVQLVQGLYVSTASSGNLLGSSLAVAHVSDIDAVVAGAPGDNAVTAFYCNSLMPAQKKSGRCH